MSFRADHDALQVADPATAGWRDEEYLIYAPAPSRGVRATFRGPREGETNPLPGSNEAFRMERSACSLFGIATFGVHCTGELPARVLCLLQLADPTRAVTRLRRRDG